MAIGDLNKKFGWLWLLITPLMGMYLTFKSGDPAWREVVGFDTCYDTTPTK